MVLLTACLIGGCVKPFEPRQDLDEFIFSWGFLKIFYIFQEELTFDPLSFPSVESLYNVVKDPYTFYIPPEQFNDEEEGEQGRLSIGLGVFLGQSGEKYYIRHLIDPSPAKTAGLIENDTLISADGKTLIGVDSYTLFQSLKGKLNSQLLLTIKRSNLILDFVITRGYFTAPSVFLDTLDNINQIYHLSLLQFTDSTTHPQGSWFELVQAIQKVENAKMTILDLRGNPGGLLDQCLLICEEFLKSGQIIAQARIRILDSLSSESGITLNKTYQAQLSNDIAEQRDFILLVDRYSASAAELLTIALKANRPDIHIMGERTYGKARAQLVASTPSGGQIRVTSQTLLSSTGFDYNEIGIEPNENLSPDSSSYWLNQAYLHALQELGIPKTKISAQNIRRFRNKLNLIDINRRLLLPSTKNPLPFFKIQ